jgi:hypothetical protein
MTREEIQQITDAYAKQLKTRKQQPAATATDSDFGQSERTEAAFNDIKRLTVRHSVADSIKSFVLKRNMEAQKKKEKAKENNQTSSPFWY